METAPFPATRTLEQEKPLKRDLNMPVERRLLEITFPYLLKRNIPGLAPLTVRTSDRRSD